MAGLFGHRGETDYLIKVKDGQWRTAKTGELLTLEKEEAPVLGHTAGDRSHNWEQLCFRNMRLRWSDICTDSQLCYYWFAPANGHRLHTPLQ